MWKEYLVQTSEYFSVVPSSRTISRKPAIGPGKGDLIKVGSKSELRPRGKPTAEHVRDVGIISSAAKTRPSKFPVDIF